MSGFFGVVCDFVDDEGVLVVFECHYKMWVGG